MNIDEDTCEWLGLPTPLEMHRQQCLLLENEIQELSLLLRKARADIFGMAQLNGRLAEENRRIGGELKGAKIQIARLTSETSEMLSKVGSLERIRHQRDHLLRQMGLETDLMLKERQSRHPSETHAP